jgi:hypothetical protein
MPTVNVKTADVLDATKCETPGCTCDDTFIHLRSECCGAECVAFYDKSYGLLVFECPECRSEICDVPVMETRTDFAEALNRRALA